jgi:uncharacterized protein YueI
MIKYNCDRREHSAVYLNSYFRRTISLSKEKTMKSEYNFSKAEQGKFYNTDATFHYPIYLETDVDQFLQKIAENKNIDLQILVNELLRNNIKIIQSVQ